MKRLILDTSIFVAIESGRPVADLPEGSEFAISVVTVAELRLGVLLASTQTRARRLRTLERVLEMEPLVISPLVAEHFADVVAATRAEGRRMGIQDAWIAATALAAGAGVATQDADFEGIAGLEVIRV